MNRMENFSGKKIADDATGSGWPLSRRARPHAARPHAATRHLPPDGTTPCGERIRLDRAVRTQPPTNARPAMPDWAKAAEFAGRKRPAPRGQVPEMHGNFGVKKISRSSGGRRRRARARPAPIRKPRRDARAPLLDIAPASVFPRSRGKWIARDSARDEGVPDRRGAFILRLRFARTGGRASSPVNGRAVRGKVWCLII